MKLLQLTDSHYAQTYPQDKLFNVLTQQVKLEDKLASIQVQEDIRTFDGLIVSGDLIHDGDVEDYLFFDQLIRQWFPNDNIFYTLGNHDLKSNFRQALCPDANWQTYDYSLLVKDLHLIFLDTSRDGVAIGSLSDQQLIWLKDQVTSNDLPKLVVQHHPIIGGPGFRKSILENPAKEIEILQDDSVLALLCGHSHFQALDIYQHLVQYTCPALGFGIDYLADGLRSFNNHCGYAVITWENQQLTVQAKLLKPDFQTYRHA